MTYVARVRPVDAARLAIELPWSGKKIVLEAPLPEDLRQLTDRAREV